MSENSQLTLSLAPHISSNQSLKTVMWLVIAALMPSTIFAVYTFGLHTFLVIIVAIVSACAAEALFRLALKRDFTVFNGSAFLTGLLLAMNLPPLVPLWIPVLGSFFAIIITKEIFGGLGFNIFNPALAGRAFLMASWPALMTTGWFTFKTGGSLSQGLTNSTHIAAPAFDALTQATPLGALKAIGTLVQTYNVYDMHIYPLLFDVSTFKSMAMGTIGGCIGETSALLLLAGALFLLITRVISWEIPLTYIGSFALIIFSYYHFTGFVMPVHALVYHLLSGGLFLGAFFMATDMVTSPVTRKGMIIFGVGCGIIASAIRLWGGYPEGVSYSILLMNAAVPLIDKLTPPKIFGMRK